MSNAYTNTNKWWEYQNVLYPVTCWIDLGSVADLRRGHFVASKNAIAINVTIIMPVNVSVVDKISR